MKLTPTSQSLSPLLGRALAIGVVALTLSGCMISRPESGATFRYVADHWVPESERAQTWMLPILFPLGTVAVLTDAVVVHPVSILDDAVEDVKDGLWSDMKWDEQYMTESAALPWRVVFSPIFYVFDVAGRSLFEIPKAAETERKREQREAQELALAETADEAQEDGGGIDVEGQSLEALMEQISLSDELPAESLKAARLQVLSLARDGGEYHLFVRLALTDYSEVTGSPEYEELLKEMVLSDQVPERRTAFECRWRQQPRSEKVATEILKEMLADRSADIRREALWRGWHGHRTWPKSHYGALRSKIELIAAEDPSEELRIEARSLLLEMDRID